MRIFAPLPSAPLFAHPASDAAEPEDPEDPADPEYTDLTGFLTFFSREFSPPRLPPMPIIPLILHLPRVLPNYYRNIINYYQIIIRLLSINIRLLSDYYQIHYGSYQYLRINTHGSMSRTAAGLSGHADHKQAISPLQPYRPNPTTKQRLPKRVNPCLNKALYLL